MSTSQNVSRRQFLRGMAGAAGGVMAFPYVISSSALGKAGNVAPRERIATAMLGRPLRSPWHL